MYFFKSFELPVRFKDAGIFVMNIQLCDITTENISGIFYGECNRKVGELTFEV